MNKCCERVRIAGLNFPKYRDCQCPARVERDGKHYCLRHDPVRVKANRDKREADYRARYERENRANEHRWACIIACAGMSDPVRQVSALKAFVSKVARDGNIALPPSLRSEAHALLDPVNPRPTKPEEPE